MRHIQIDSQTHLLPEDIGCFIRLHKCSEDCPCEPELLDKDDPEDENEVWVHNRVQ